MANFNQTNVTGTAYQRSPQIVINNQLGQLPSISFVREQIVDIGGDKLNKSLSTVTKVFMPENADTEFQLYNPQTGEEIEGETATYSDVYALIYSLFIVLATEQDAYDEQMRLAMSMAPNS